MNRSDIVDLARDAPDRAHKDVLAQRPTLAALPRGGHVRSALQRLRLAAAANDVSVRDETGYVVLVSRGHPHGLGVAVAVRGDVYVRLPDDVDDEEVATTDADIVIEWVSSV